MFKLVILQRYAAILNHPDASLELDTDFENSSQAELRAIRWLIGRPDDIIMLVEVKVSICGYCDVPIEESIGWVRHRWVHLGGYYTCLNSYLTQATPKEEIM